MSKESTSDNSAARSRINISPDKPTRKVKAAYQQIREFFTCTDFPSMKKLLHQWLLAGIENQHEWKHEDTVNLIYKMEFLMELTGALWVLYKAGINYTTDDIIIRDNDRASERRFSSRVDWYIRFQHYDETDFFTHELSKEEEENPFLVTRELFGRLSLRKLRQFLQHWRDTALTDPWNYAAMDKVEMTALYTDIDRMVEAAFIINEVQLLGEEQKDE